jgi:hypothetical protein
MKAGTLFLALLFAGLNVASTEGAEKDRTISKVVKLLKNMLDKSKKEAEEDGVAYAKYKCYVDKNEAEKTESITRLAEQIELLSSKIAELQATNGELASESAKLNTEMTINEATQKQAKDIRENSEKTFKAMKEDLEKGIEQMDEAISVLEALGEKAALINKRVQLKGTKEQKKALLMNLDAEVKKALNAASVLLPAEKRSSLESFLQASSGMTSKNGAPSAIVGILKDMLSTFKQNLKNAKKSEEAEKEAYESSKDTLKDSYEKMEKAVKKKSADMGTNDDELGSKKTQLEESKKQKKSDEEFLENLREMAAEKEKDYQERKMLRANEDAAIAEAISILNSDDAFETFGSVDATSTGGTGAASFLQLSRGAVRQQARALLEAAAGQSSSARLARLAASLKGGNPFNTVLAEIEKIKDTIVKEGEADKEKKDWCKKETDNSKKDLDAKKDEIKTLNGEIDKLDETINDPKTGLKVQVSEKEASLIQNAETQKEETADRKEENAAYKVDVANAADAEEILARAIKVLKRYYDALDKKMKEKSLLQTQKEDPKPPETYDAFEGQSESGGKVLDMLEFILKETEKEHKKADEDEDKAQTEFEDSIKKLKKEEKELQSSLVKLKESIAEKEKELEEKQGDLKDTIAAKETIEAYLEKIKPGCDFIEENFDMREKNRATETEALEKAVKLIKGTSAYKDAKKKEEALLNGKCKSDCKLDNTALSCKACMAGSSEKDYCKSKPGTPGCK